MISDQKLHDALRYSGFCLDETFDAAGPEHRRKVQIALEELGQTEDARQTIEYLEERVEELEHECEETKRDLRETEDEVSREESALRERIRDLTRELDDRQPAAVSP